MVREFLAADVEGIEGVGAVGAVFEQVFFALGEFFAEGLQPDCNLQKVYFS